VAEQGFPLAVEHVAPRETQCAPASELEHIMPRYYFHVSDGYSAPDDEGTELPDIYTAQAEALRMSGEILREGGTQFRAGTECKLEVADERGQVLFVLRFSAKECALSGAAESECEENAEPSARCKLCWTRVQDTGATTIHLPELKLGNHARRTAAA
jgi:hypothetical protein